jgi:hypothetical protein
MDKLQENFERTVGEAFVSWYNESTGRSFFYARRPDEVPDLEYSDGTDILRLEITTAYYDEVDARFWWQNLRKHPDAPTGWGGKDMDEALIEDVSRRINEKSKKTYGDHCTLIVYVHPAMTLKEEVDELLQTVSLPAQYEFEAIYLTGHFPMSTRSWGGYQCWKLA